MSFDLIPDYKPHTLPLYLLQEFLQVGFIPMNVFALGSQNIALLLILTNDDYNKNKTSNVLLLPHPNPHLISPDQQCLAASKKPPRKSNKHASMLCINNDCVLLCQRCSQLWKINIVRKRSI